MASLTGSTIASSYEQLLSLPDGGLNGNALVAITDGDSSTTIGMKVATNKIEIIPGSNDANAFEVSQADGTAILTINSSTPSVLVSGSGTKLYFSDAGGEYLSGDGTDLTITSGNDIVLAMGSGGDVYSVGADGNTGNTIFGKSNFNTSTNNASDYNTFIGEGTAGTGSVAGATNNVGIGYEAMKALTSGDNNVVIGKGAGVAMTTAADNIIIGEGAGDTLTAAMNNHVLIGRNAGAGIESTDSNGTIAIGYQAGKAITSGQKNVAIGFEAQKAQTTGDRNTVIGYSAMQAADGGEDFNTVIGSEAGYGINNDASHDNVIIGKNALQGGTGTILQNVAIGSNALTSVANNSQTGAVAIGYSALGDLTTGVRNTGVGYLSTYANVAGADNTALGYNSLAGLNHADGDHNTAVGVNGGSNLVTGYQNTFIGSNNQPSASGSINQTTLGYAVTGVANNSVTLGNDAVTALYASSDAGADIHGGRLALGKAKTDPTCLMDIRGSTTPATRLFAVGTDSTATAFSVVSAGTNSATYSGDGTAVVNIGSAVSGNLEVSLTTKGSCHLAQIAGGEVFVGNNSNRIAESTGAGATITSSGQLIGVVAEGNPLGLNRLTNDGSLVEFRQAGSLEGTINVSSNTVSLVGFSGRHESSGIADNVALGTVVSTIDELDVHGETGKDRADHAKIKVSDSVGDKRVYGVLVQYDENFNKPIIAAVGLGSVRVTGACEGGDLLESNGDGTAKVQSDDIIKSKTIGKVTIGDSNTGVKLVSCVLYCG